MPESTPTNQNFLDPRSPDYAYASRAKAKQYQKQIDSEYSVPDEYVKERKRLEQQAFDLVGQITRKYYDQIMKLAQDHQPSTAAPAQVSMPSQAAAPSARYIQGQPPGWRGIRGMLRWLWYGKHADNPDYAPYEVNPGEQNESLSLNQYARFMERAEVTVERITEEVFGNVLSEEDNDFQRMVGELLNQFKQELIRLVIRPMFHQFWRTGLHRGIEMSNKAGGPPEVTSSDDGGDDMPPPDSSAPPASSEPVSPGKPESAPRASGDTLPTSDSEDVSTSKPSSPPTNPEDLERDNPPEAEEKPSIEEPPQAEEVPTLEDPPQAEETPTEKPKKKNKGAHSKLLDMLEDVDSVASAYSNPEALSYLASLTGSKKRNAFKKMYEKIPLKNWDEVTKSLEAFVSSDLYNQPGGLKAALRELKNDVRNAPPEQIAQELKNNPLMTHLWNLLSVSEGTDVDIDKLQDEISNIRSRKMAQGRNAPRRNRNKGGTRPRINKSRSAGEGTRRKLSPEEIEAKKQAVNSASKEAEDIVTQASSEDDATTKPNPPKSPKRKRGTTERPKKSSPKEEPTDDSGDNIGDVDVNNDWPKPGASKDEVKGFIKKGLKEMKSDSDPTWADRAWHALSVALDKWIGDDNKKTDFARDVYEKELSDLFVGEEMQDDSGMENLGGTEDSFEGRPNEAMVHMIGRKWLESLTLESRKRYYRILMREGRSGPYVQRSIVDRMPLQERNSYYRELLKNRSN